MDLEMSHADAEHSKNSWIYCAEVLSQLKAFVSQLFFYQEPYHNNSLLDIYRGDTNKLFLCEYTRFLPSFQKLNDEIKQMTKF